MSSSDSSSGKATELLDWLAAAPAELAEEIAQLRPWLKELASPQITPAQQHRCIELFSARALRMAGDLQPQLARSGLPLNRDLHASARLLSEALVAIAEGFLNTIAAAEKGEILAQQHLTEALAGRGLRMLLEAQKTQGLAGSGHLSGIWNHALALLRASRLDTGPASPNDLPDSAALTARQLLALGALPIESFSQSELGWICAWLASAAALIEITPSPPLPAGGFWLCAGTPPQACSRRLIPTDGEKLFFSTAALTRRILDLLARLEAGQTPIELPSPTADIQPQSLLRRLADEWQHSTKREQARSDARYRIQVCAGLPSIWKVLRGTDAELSLIHEWQVLNESPGGYSILHVAAQVEALSAGMAIALRQTPHSPWVLCIVRWIRCEHPQQVELGLQTVATGASPVSVGFRGRENREAKMIDALVLPTAATSRPHPAILAPAGTYTSRRFALVSESDRLYVAQGRLLSLDMQTASIELFQFEIDPYPI